MVPPAWGYRAARHGKAQCMAEPPTALADVPAGGPEAPERRGPPPQFGVATFTRPSESGPQVVVVPLQSGSPDEPIRPAEGRHRLLRQGQEVGSVPLSERFGFAGTSAPQITALGRTAFAFIPRYAAFSFQSPVDGDAQIDLGRECTWTSYKDGETGMNAAASMTTSWYDWGLVRLLRRAAGALHRGLYRLSGGKLVGRQSRAMIAEPQGWRLPSA